ncbi:hypothetical protein CJP74_01365 [Psittacicella melopsittaci]|uniref:Glycosyltransferase 2-like domain-containing protein n=1 Tax=Psittacicella melopsittaci TaxID=2028576 RepID=A0A3A1YBS8_9GAMM|nr:glycosyltransferase family 2 protein [Psittacicella melopsittaci]RIY33664.1 hypothetical protein CJP74_01365 [Psittacicella melopsittaci]
MQWPWSTKFAHLYKANNYLAVRQEKFPRWGKKEQLYYILCLAASGYKQAALHYAHWLGKRVSSRKFILEALPLLAVHLPASALSWYNLHYALVKKHYNSNWLLPLAGAASAVGNLSMLKHLLVCLEQRDIRFTRKQQENLYFLEANYRTWLAEAVEDYVPRKVEHILKQEEPEVKKPRKVSYAYQALCHLWQSQGLASIPRSCPDLTFNLSQLESYTPSQVSGPLVSIIVTCYNAEQTLLLAVNSLREQTYQNLEIIVIDDASTQDIKSLINPVCQADARVRYVRLPANIGTFGAKNLALKLTNGQFVTTHDADDWAHPEKIARQVQPLLEHPELIATTSRWLKLDQEGIFTARLVYPLIRLNPASPLWRKELVLSKLGGWDWVRTGADSEFLARLKRAFGEKAVLNLQQVLVLGNELATSLMHDPKTGYSSLMGSAQRLTYLYAWQSFLTTARPEQLYYEPNYRAFAVPQALEINTANLAQDQEFITQL